MFPSPFRGPSGQDSQEAHRALLDAPVTAHATTRPRRSRSTASKTRASQVALANERNALMTAHATSWDLDLGIWDFRRAVGFGAWDLELPPERRPTRAAMAKGSESGCRSDRRFPCARGCGRHHAGDDAGGRCHRRNRWRSRRQVVRSLGERRMRQV